MGNCFGGAVDKEAAEKNRQIEIEMKKYREAMAKENKILLLGPGESGKSTVFKQMKIVQDSGGFSTDERMQFKHIVHANCISQMRVLVQACARLKQPFTDPNAFTYAMQLLELPQNTLWSVQLGMMIKALWQEKGIRAMYDQAGSAFQLNDSAAYFFDGIDRFIQPDYCPTLDDVLRVRVRSTGIEETQFTFDHTSFKVMDVGGQRSERRKWIHCFENVSAILYCAALSCYDQVLREDRDRNRMIESIELFEEVANSAYFVDTRIILFLNKTDLLMEKLQRGINLNILYPAYTGGLDYEAACAFIEARFREVVNNRKPDELAVHKTCAVDTKQIEFVIRKVRQFVLIRMAEREGLM